MPPLQRYSCPHFRQRAFAVLIIAALPRWHAAPRQPVTPAAASDIATLQAASPDSLLAYA